MANEVGKSFCFLRKEIKKEQSGNVPNVPSNLWGCAKTAVGNDDTPPNN